MAKRKRKKSQSQLAYEKQEKRIKQFIRRAEKRGYMFEEGIIPQRPKRYTQAKVRELEKLTPKELYKHSVYGGAITEGEEFPGEIGRQFENVMRSRKAAETRKANKEAERRFWTQEDAEDHRNEIPNGGQTIFRNVLDEFIARLSEPVSQYTPWQRKRQKNAMYESERQKHSLYSLVMSVISKDGEEAVGWRIQSDPELDSYLTYVLHGSKSELIQTASLHIAEVIKGDPLAVLEMRDLAEESESEENWESPE